VGVVGGGFGCVGWVVCWGGGDFVLFFAGHRSERSLVKAGGGPYFLWSQRRDTWSRFSFVFTRRNIRKKKKGTSRILSKAVHQEGKVDDFRRSRLRTKKGRKKVLAKVGTEKPKMMRKEGGKEVPERVENYHRSGGGGSCTGGRKKSRRAGFSYVKAKV